MRRLAQLIVTFFFLLYFIPAQASLDAIAGGCMIFADEGTADEKKEEGKDKKKEGEAEPDCD